jgi:hypothetical protein
MAADAIDTTAIAAIVIGLGGTVAAMVYPVKYADAPKWAVGGAACFSFALASSI